MTTVTARSACLFLYWIVPLVSVPVVHSNANSYREDEAALARFVRQALEAEHNAGDVSADGEQARALASELDYDLIVLDLNHPRLAPLAV